MKGVVSRHVFDGFLSICLVSLLVAGVVTLLAWFLAWRAEDSHDRRDIARLSLLFLCLSLLGVISGFSGGLSREAAVGDIIPAALALLGGVAVYLFGVDSTRGAVVSLATITFAVGIYYGYGLGADRRSGVESLQRFRAHCFSVFSDADLVADPGALKFQQDAIGDMCAAAIASEITRSGVVESKYFGALQTQVTRAMDHWASGGGIGDYDLP